MRLWRTQIGQVEVLRIEEMLTPGFDPSFLFPDYDPEVLAEHPQLAQSNFFDQAKFSIKLPADCKWGGM